MIYGNSCYLRCDKKKKNQIYVRTFIDFLADRDSFGYTLPKLLIYDILTAKIERNLTFLIAYVYENGTINPLILSQFNLTKDELNNTFLVGDFFVKLYTFFDFQVKCKVSAGRIIKPVERSRSKSYSVRVFSANQFHFLKLLGEVGKNIFSAGSTLIYLLYLAQNEVVGCSKWWLKVKSKINVLDTEGHVAQ